MKTAVENRIAERARIGGLALLLAAITVLFAPPARAQSDNAKKQAQALQAEGLRLMQKGDNRGALAKFNEAFALVQSPKIMFNMGKAYSALGNDVEALRAYDTFLDEAPFAPKASRDEAEREAQALRPKLAYIEVATDDSGSTVRIDGRDIGKAPLVRPVVVAPGTHEVKLEKSGMVAETRSVAPIAGQKLRVVVKLSPVPPPEAHRQAQRQAENPPVVVTRPPANNGTGESARRTAAVETDAPDTNESERPPHPIVDNPPVEPPRAGRPWQISAGIVSATVGVLALGGGITAQVLWSQKNAQFNGVMDTPTHAQCTTLKSDFGGEPCTTYHNQANLLLTLTIAGYATAGATAIAALVFFLSAPRSGDAHTPAGNSVSLGCLPTASSSGFSCMLTTRF